VPRPRVWWSSATSEAGECHLVCSPSREFRDQQSRAVSQSVRCLGGCVCVNHRFWAQQTCRLIQPMDAQAVLWYDHCWAAIMAPFWLTASRCIRNLGLQEAVEIGPSGSFAPSLLGIAFDLNRSVKVAQRRGEVRCLAKEGWPICDFHGQPDPSSQRHATGMSPLPSHSRNHCSCRVLLFAPLDRRHRPLLRAWLAWVRQRV